MPLPDTEIDDELPPRPRRRLVTPAALALCGVVIGAAGFYGGVEVQKGQDDGGAGAAPGAVRGGFPGGGGQMPAGGMPGGGTPGGGFGGGGDGAMTVGEITGKKGRTLYVQTTDGTTVKVTTNAGSTVTRNAATSVKGLYPGDTVMVAGEANAKGTVTATRITATAASASAGR